MAVMETATVVDGGLVTQRPQVSWPATLLPGLIVVLLASILAGLWAWSSHAVMFPLEVICLR